MPVVHARGVRLICSMVAIFGSVQCLAADPVTERCAPLANSLLTKTESTQVKDIEEWIAWKVYTENYQSKENAEADGISAEAVVYGIPIKGAWSRDTTERNETRAKLQAHFTNRVAQFEYKYLLTLVPNVDAMKEYTACIQAAGTQPFYVACSLRPISKSYDVILDVFYSSALNIPDPVVKNVLVTGAKQKTVSIKKITRGNQSYLVTRDMKKDINVEINTDVGGKISCDSKGATDKINLEIAVEGDFLGDPSITKADISALRGGNPCDGDPEDHSSLACPGPNELFLDLGTWNEISSGSPKGHSEITNKMLVTNPIAGGERCIRIDYTLKGRGGNNDFSCKGRGWLDGWMGIATAKKTSQGELKAIRQTREESGKRWKIIRVC